jgi:hypothetical protein
VATAIYTRILIASLGLLAPATSVSAECLLAFMSASREEIKDVQLRMGRVWR